LKERRAEDGVLYRRTTMEWDHMGSVFVKQEHPIYGLIHVACSIQLWSWQGMTCSWKVGREEDIAGIHVVFRQWPTWIDEEHTMSWWWKWLTDRSRHVCFLGFFFKLSSVRKRCADVEVLLERSIYVLLRRPSSIWLGVVEPISAHMKQSCLLWHRMRHENQGWAFSSH
jgi:hypothetical protein